MLANVTNLTQLNNVWTYTLDYASPVDVYVNGVLNQNAATSPISIYSGKEPYVQFIKVNTAKYSNGTVHDVIIQDGILRIQFRGNKEADMYIIYECILKDDNTGEYNYIEKGRIKESGKGYYIHNEFNHISGTFQYCISTIKDGYANTSKIFNVNVFNFSRHKAIDITVTGNHTIKVKLNDIN